MRDGELFDFPCSDTFRAFEEEICGINYSYPISRKLQDKIDINWRLHYVFVPKMGIHVPIKKLEDIKKQEKMLFREISKRDSL